jgi:microcompartment protein CcmK/EutM
LLLVVAAVERLALVKRQRFSRFAVAVDSAGASDGDIAFVAVASCSEMADVDASSDADSVVWGCEEIDDLKRCR